ncbi:MAG: dihydroorotate dehydrogenase [Coriobacteriia bacterium]|nr:dihydroorotate dehydrogenase [Coriobacteriia bacterium]MDI6844265.1 dihydroorotate dehydrogenase [Anaerosomatales bacterium]
MSRPVVDLSARIGGLTLPSCVLPASGTFGSGREYADFVDLARLGAVVTKGVSLEPWLGNPQPRIVETASGMLNSIGLQNPGVEAFCASDLPWLASQGLKVIVNVSGHSLDEYVAVARRLERESAVHALELNVSCPNVDAGGMQFGTSCEAAASVTAAVRAVSTKTLIVKLSPNVGDIAAIARAVQDAGADAVSLINTLLGMAIDVRTQRPVLARRVGGLSGPAIKPVALRMVWDVYEAVSIPIIGMGGIMTAHDAIEFLLAGARAVAVGTANFVDPAATTRILDGIEAYCRERGVERVSDLVGAAHSQ